MSILFADIFEAIRTLRVCKGTSEKEILKYVQERAGGCLSVNNVIKTMCTLNKLVEEGVLVKKGKRYSLPKPPPKREDDDMDQEEEKDDECDEDDDDNMKDSCDDLGDDDEEEDCPEGGDDDNDDDDDDDDDDEDEEDDDDDDDDQNMNKDEDEDDENCNDKVEENKKEEKKDDCPEGEGEDEVEKRANGNANGAANGNGDIHGKGGSGELTCTTSFENTFAAQKHSSTKKSKRYSGMVNKAENIAFCARDFMDSQYHSYPDGPGKMEDVMGEDQKDNEKSKEVANIFQARRRGSRSRQSHLSNPNYRSRSPVKEAATDALQHRLAMEASDEIGPLNNFKEAGDMELDVEANRQEDFELFNRPSPIDPHPLNTSGSVIDRRESYGNTQDKKEIKPEPVVASNQYGLKKHGEIALGVLKAKNKKCKKGVKEAKREKHKRGTSHIKKIDDSKKSVCSVCDKKKRKKKN